MFTFGFQFVHVHPPLRESQPFLILRPISTAETDAARARTEVRSWSCILKLVYDFSE